MPPSSKRDGRARSITQSVPRFLVRRERASVATATPAPSPTRAAASRVLERGARRESTSRGGRAGACDASEFQGCRVETSFGLAR